MRTKLLLFWLGLIEVGCPPSSVTQTPKVTPAFDDRAALFSLHQAQEKLIWRENLFIKEKYDLPEVLYFTEDQFVWGLATYHLADKILFLFAQSFDNNFSHGSPVSVVAAVYAIESGRWALQYVEDLGPHGSYGVAYASQFSLVEVGPGRMAIRSDDQHLDSGYISEAVTFYELSPVGDELLSIQLHNDTTELCAQNKDEGCYSYQGELHFESGKNKEFYDIIIEFKGSRPDEYGQIEPYDRIERYTLHNGRYQLINES